MGIKVLTISFDKIQLAVVDETSANIQMTVVHETSATSASFPK